MLPEWEKNTPNQRPLKANYYQGNTEEQSRAREARNPRSGYQNQYQSLELPSNRKNPNISLDCKQKKLYPFYNEMINMTDSNYADSPNSYRKAGNSSLLNNQYS